MVAGLQLFLLKVVQKRESHWHVWGAHGFRIGGVMARDGLTGIGRRHSCARFRPVFDVRCLAVVLACLPTGVLAADLAQANELPPSELVLTGHRAIASQSGSHNRAVINQVGASQRASLSQTGTAHQATVVQSGARNAADIQQQGEGHIAELLQFGADNQAAIISSGYRNQASIVQIGNFNQAEIQQSGQGLNVVIRQIGDHLKARLVRN